MMEMGIAKLTAYLGADFVHEWILPPEIPVATTDFKGWVEREDKTDYLTFIISKDVGANAITASVAKALILEQGVFSYYIWTETPLEQPIIGGSFEVRYAGEED